MSKKTLFQLPKEKENIKHVTLTEINPIYQLYEDRTIFSRARGSFVKFYKSRNNQYCVLSVAEEGKTNSTYSVESLVRKYITGKITPQIEGVEHKPMIGYQGIYQIYSNGQVWSYVKNKWLTACLESRGKYKLYCLQDAKGKVKTEYVHRLLAENFILNEPLNGRQVHHKDHNQKNNSIDNLIVLAPLEHIQFHKTNRVHSTQFLAKKAERDRIKQEEKRAKQLKGRHLTEEHKQKIREAQIANWERRAKKQ